MIFLVGSSPATFETPVMRKIESVEYIEKLKENPVTEENEENDVSSIHGKNFNLIFLLPDSLNRSRNCKKIIAYLFVYPEKEQRLDEFLRTYTSEDNESFEELVIESEIRQRTKVRHDNILILFIRK